MRRIIPRYLLRNFLPHFILTLGVLMSILAMSFFVRLVTFATEKGISMSWTMSSFGDLAPYLLSLSLPISFLVALLLTLAQLAESGEITALRASGFSFFDILAPFLWTAAFLSVLLLPLNHLVSPDGLHNFRDSFREGLRDITRLDLEPKTLLDLGPFKFFANEVDKQDRSLHRVHLYRSSTAAGRLRVQADRGTYQLLKGKGIELILEEGVIQLPHASDPSRLALASFDKYTVFVPFITRGFARIPPTRELTSTALLGRLKDPALPVGGRAETRTELSLRSAIAFSPLIFFCIAAPLGLRIEKRSRSTALAWSLVVLFCFYGILAFGIIVGNRSAVLSSFSPWLADVAGLVAGAALARHSFR